MEFGKGNSFKKFRTFSSNESNFRGSFDVSNRNFFGSLPMIFGKDESNSERKKFDRFKEYSMITGSVQFIKYVPMRITRTRFSCPSVTRDCNTLSGLQINHMSQRRESFLYKYEVDSAISPERFSRQTSIMSGENISAGCVEDIIVTPFAQILAVLHRVRTNVADITSFKLPTSTTDCEPPAEQLPTETNTNSINDSLEALRAKETMYMLDWCLENLENIQTDRSVSNLATVKFKKMLNFELHQYDDNSSSDHQISDYICNTFLDDRFEAEESCQDILSVNGKTASVENIGDSKIKIIENDNFPLLGIPCSNESKIYNIFENSLNEWGVDLFEVHELSNNSLTLVTYSIFKNRQIISSFKIPNDVLINFLLKIEATYKDLPYHNSIHAADVTQTANVILNLQALQNVFTDLEKFAVLFACVIHDVDHPGLTNQYLINTNDQLATLYNDQSVLENHHLATSFAILKEKNYDILFNLTKQEKSTFRKLVIDMVLSTDMSRHMNLLADLKTMVETKKVSGSGLLDMDKYNDRVTILQNLVHCADLSNPTKPIKIYEEWVARIMEEFFLQGDREKEMGLDVSAMCDRENAAVARTQIGFIDYIVHPLWESWCELVQPDAQSVLDILAENRKFYIMKTCSSQTIAEVDINEDDNESKTEDSE